MTGRRTPYKILAESELLKFSRRIRKTKSRTHDIKTFQGMIEKGLISGLRVKNGVIIDADFVSNELTEKQKAILRRVVQLSHEAEGRRLSIPDTLTEKSIKFFRAHGLQGGFRYFHSIIEYELIAGNDISQSVSAAERINNESYTALRKQGEKSIGEVKRNARKQLLYFQALLKKKKLKRMRIFHETSQIDEMFEETISEIRLTNSGVEKVTISHIDKKLAFKITVSIDAGKLKATMADFN